LPLVEIGNGVRIETKMEMENENGIENRATG
jgi:hypothetical protein